MPSAVKWPNYPSHAIYNCVTGMEIVGTTAPRRNWHTVGSLC